MISRVIGGRYQLNKLLGEGGMALVYRATDLNLRRPVAIKILREQYAADPEVVERFEREARSAAALSHPNIVGVYDRGFEDGMHYIVMEYVEGETLKEIIRRQGPLPVDRIIHLGVQLADALEHAHRHGVVHRDVKPQNILVTADGRARIMDFGIAVAAGESQLTRAGMALGTADYISPEQARGDPAGPPSDVYSAGLVLYEMATGRPPFRAQNPMAIARMHIEDPPPLPAVLNPALPSRLESVILKSLAKDPSRRFATAGDLARALREYEAESNQFTMPRLPQATAALESPAIFSRAAVRDEAYRRRPSSLGSFLSWVAGGAVLVAVLVVVLPLLVSALFSSGGPAPRTSSPEVAGALPTVPAATRAPTQTAPAAAPTSAPARPTAAPTATPPPPAPTAKPAPAPTVQPAPAAPAPQPPIAGGTPSQALQAAVARVAQAGYRVSDTSSYDASQSLRVLIGTAAGSADGYDQRAFFFLGDSYLGTDTASPSAQISFQGQDGNVVTIAYALYRPKDPMNKPRGGKVGVRYQWNWTRLVPLDPIPPDDPKAELSRR